MEKVNIEPDHIAELTKRLIQIHRKWIIDGVGDAQDKKNEEAGLREQQVAIDEFAEQRGLPEGVRSKLGAAIRQFLVGGPTGDGDGPLVEHVTEDAYCEFAVRLSNAIADGRELGDVFASLQIKTQIARQIYIAMERLGADDELLSIFENWRHTLDDEEILSLLRDYNASGKVLRPRPST